VSPLCLGTMNFGSSTPLPQAKDIADNALDAGVFFWDTADMYGNGASEEVVGQLLRRRRQEVVLGTKVYAPMGPGPNDRGLSARHILSACEASLRRLDTDWIDLYYLHLPDRAVRTEETLRAMEDLVRSGKVRYLGCSNYWTWEIMSLLRVADRQGWQPLSAVQPLYNLVNRDIEVELLPMASSEGLGVVTYSPLARGILTGKYSFDDAPPPDSRLARNNPRFLKAEWRRESVEVAQALGGLAQERSCQPAELAIAWTLANPHVHSVIMGPRTSAHLDTYLRGASIDIDPDLESAIDALVPPGTHTGSAFPDDHYFPIRGRC
jgi:aryl-alcohol dehydrogenase-like predicted oxidoreductase